MVLGQTLKGLSLGFRDKGLGVGLRIRVYGLEFIVLSPKGEIQLWSTNRYFFCFMSIHCSLVLHGDLIAMYRNLIWHINGLYTFYSSPWKSLQ